MSNPKRNQFPPPSRPLRGVGGGPYLLPPNQFPALLLAGLVIGLLALYMVAMRGRFSGPKVTLSSLEHSAK